jgi:hypothetical protein
MSSSTLVELAQRFGREASAMSAAAARYDVRIKLEKDLAEKSEKLRRELEVSIFQA